MNRQILVIVPRLPPAIDGLGDYGLSLAIQLRNDFNILTEFLVADLNWVGSTEIEGFKVHKLTNRSSAELSQMIHSFDKILLHYVGYGYAKRGCPSWLISGLENWKLKKSKKLITMFHELYAFGPIWNSQFWTSPLQRFLAKKLVNISDNCITSKSGYAEIIKRFSKDIEKSITTMPVFSNVGEVSNPVKLINREKTLIVFGGANWRKKTYIDSRHELEKIISELSITKLIDIGKPLDIEINLNTKIEIQLLGNISAIEIDNLMAKSLVGFFTYPTEYLCKSGIFAAYCSHGLVPIGRWDKFQNIDEVISGKHFWEVSLSGEVLNLVTAQKIADTAHRWYGDHNKRMAAKIFSQIILN